MNFTPQQQHSLLSKMGYSGPVDSRMMEQFIQSNPGAAAKMGKFDRAMKRGFQTGGLAAPGQTSLLGNRNFIGDPSNRPYMVPIQSAITPTVAEPITATPLLDATAKTTPSITQTPEPTTSSVPSSLLSAITPTTTTVEPPVEPTPSGVLKKPTGITSVTSQAKDTYSEAIDNLVKAEKEAAGWSSEVQTMGDGTSKVKLSNSVTGEEKSTKWKPTEESAKVEAEELLNELQTKPVQEAQKEFKEAEQELAVAREKEMLATPSAAEVTQQAISDPTALVTQVEPAKIQETPGQIVGEETGVVEGEAPKAAVSIAAPAAKAAIPVATPAATMKATKVTPQVTEELTGLKAAQGEVSKTITAAQQTTSAVSELEAAQGQSILMDNPVQREIQEGELISGSAVDAQKVEQMNAQLQAAQATPSEKATVQGQLSDLMQQFEGGKTPAWAAGAMRNAQAMLAQRGLGASSMAGQAVIQAAMESALPIAQADANTRAQFESQNLSNRQQVAMFAAQQRAAFLQIEFDQEFQSRVQNAARIADIANMNFTAEQQIALENSRIANTMNLQNLSNRQAMVIAEASALSNLELSNLNNRQQAAVQNAQNFLQMDLANLNNEQQTAIFKTQQRVNALLSDQAAENAAEQFNAASENQTNQFFADLQSTISRFNADQTNAINQFNAGQENAAEQFNASLQEQRDQFNANNRLVVAQANAKWRQDIATLDTAAQNEAIMEAAKTANALTSTAMDEIWMRERDLMSFSFQAAENAQDRHTELLIADKKLTTEQILQAQELSAADKAGKGAIFGSIAGKVVGGIVDSIF